MTAVVIPAENNHATVIMIKGPAAVQDWKTSKNGGCLKW